MQNLALILLDGTDYNAPPPEYIVIEGLTLRGASGDVGFTGTAGDARTYDEGAACVRVQKGAHITFRNNEISDCDNGLFSQSQEDWNIAKNTANKVNLTADILIDGNYLHDCGAATGRSKDRYHNSYIQSVGAVYQYNHYGRQRPGAQGSALKDRSIGTVVRFNRFEGCARSLDLVEAENTPLTALHDPAYRETFVYGNIIQHDSNEVSRSTTGATTMGAVTLSLARHLRGPRPTHLGLRPPTASRFFVKGRSTSTTTPSSSMPPENTGHAIFQISTTQEHAQIFNNVLWISGEPRYTGLLAPTRDLGKFWEDGGTVNLGVNLFNDGWIVNPDRGANHASHAVVTGNEKMLTTSAAPIDATSFRLVKGSPGVDAAQSAAAFPSVVSHPVDHEYTEDFRGRPRVVVGKATDLGALESF